MENNHTFAVDFLIRKCKHDKKKAFIYVRITVDEERAEISSKEQIDVTAWDGDKGIVKGKTIDVKQINEHLDDIRLKIKSKYRLFKESESLITAESVKQSYLGVHSTQKGRKLTELLDYYKKIWEDKLKQGGFKNYKTTIEYVNRFLKSKYSSKDIYLSQIDMEFVTELEYYIRHHPIKDHDPCLGNGVVKHIQRFKRIINWATKTLKWLKQNPVSDYSCPIKKSKRKKLTFEQLVKLERKEFQDTALLYVRDLFLFSCYTGFAFADVMALRKTHFEWEGEETVWCKIYRLKSDILSPLPLIRDASKIINKYTLTTPLDHAIFSPLTNQYVNRCLKVIKEICEIEIPMTFHVARHTFAKTVALKNGVPLETVQLMMGHTKITTTQIYADVDEEKILRDTAGIEEKLEAKRGIITRTLGSRLVGVV